MLIFYNLEIPLLVYNLEFHVPSKIRARMFFAAWFLPLIFYFEIFKILSCKNHTTNTYIPFINC